MNEKKYNLVRNLPVAKFRYKGNHSHPVRRTILILESNSKWIKGYELREGSVVRDIDAAPVKTYAKEKIATLRQSVRNFRLKKKKNRTTLQRFALTELVQIGL